MKYTDMEREVAAFACQVAASNEYISAIDYLSNNGFQYASNERKLTNAALDAASAVRCDREWYAEAEAMIRDGWEPE